MKTCIVIALTAIVALAAVPVVADDGGRGDVHVLRSWSDVRRTADGGLEKVRIELAFDYSAGTALRRVLTPDGQLLEQAPTDRIPSASADENRRAEAVLRDDPEFARLILERDVILDGGFVLTEADADARCSAGTRCLQIFGFARHDAHRALFCAVVDVADDTIAYRDYWDINPEVRR